MTACFWAGGPLESAGQSAVDGGESDGDDTDPQPRCPNCDTPVLVVTCHGPTEYVATPCGCRVPGELLEEDGDATND